MAIGRPSRAEGAPLGPGSILWRIAGDPRSLLTGPSAGLMQLMLPGLGAGVTDHSNFFDDPYDRIFRSMPLIWGTIFAADDAEGTATGHHIRDLHPDIKGVDHHGHRYHALDPEIFWWAHATFTWEMLRAHDLFFPVPLSPARREQLYAETVTWYRRYGVSDRPVPPTLAAFEARFADLCAHELELTPAAAWVFDDRNPATRAAPIRLPGPLGPLSPVATATAAEVLRLIVYGSFPDVVRRRLGFRWTHADRLAFLAICTTFRAATPAIDRGLMADSWPEGTPHLAPGSRSRVIVAGPSVAQRRRAAAAPA